MPSRDSKLGRISLVIFFVLLILYALYEAWGMLFGPAIEIPSESVTVYEQYTLITGHAERITELRLNGKPIPVTESGEFEEPYILAEGTNYLVLEARDARGREARETLTILYVPGASPIRTGSTTAE